jgi:hypothetical protein
MKFEYVSSYRNRNVSKSPGNFFVESGAPAISQYAYDPVCLATPIISWRPGFTLSATITTLYCVIDDNDTVELLLTFAIAPPAQCRIKDFLAGCLFSNIDADVLGCRVLTSDYMTDTQYRITIPRPASVFSTVRTYTITDYTSFSTNNVRAPTNFDYGQYGYLYNETRNQYVIIKSIDLKSRRLDIEATTAFASWTAADQLNIRDDIPSQTAIVSSSTINSITFAAIPAPATVGSWIRPRLANYSTALVSDQWTREIVGRSGNTITFFPPLSVAPTGTIEILLFSYDNYNPSQGYEDVISKKVYNVCIEALSIPNVDIYNGNLRSIPYLLVELNNTQSANSNKNLISSNNPYTTHTVFVAKLDPTSTRDTRLRFISTSVEQKNQKILMDVKEQLNVIIRLPGGQIFTPIQPDTTSPNKPISDLNISLVLDFCDSMEKKK